MKRGSETEDADRETDSSPEGSEVEAAAEVGRGVGGVGRGAMSDPSMASLPGVGGGGGRSDPSVARLPEGEAFGGDEFGDTGGPAVAGIDTGPDHLGRPGIGNGTESTETPGVQRAPQDGEDAPAGDTGVPEVVRDVVSSPGQSLDSSIQRAMEERMGDSFGDIRVHTGPKAAAAADALDARAFTVGNHVAFNRGEYDPESPEGQHVLAHELAHVRQQTAGRVSMLPADGAFEGGLEVDPDPQAEREAERAADEAMGGGPVTVNRLGTDVHVQRSSDDGLAQSFKEGALTATERDVLPEAKNLALLEDRYRDAKQEEAKEAIRANMKALKKAAEKKLKKNKLQDKKEAFDEIVDSESQGPGGGFDPYGPGHDPFPDDDDVDIGPRDWLKPEDAASDIDDLSEEIDELTEATGFDEDELEKLYFELSGKSKGAYELGKAVAGFVGGPKATVVLSLISMAEGGAEKTAPEAVVREGKKLKDTAERSIGVGDDSKDTIERAREIEDEIDSGQYDVDVVLDRIDTGDELEGVGTRGNV